MLRSPFFQVLTVISVAALASVCLVFSELSTWRHGISPVSEPPTKSLPLRMKLTTRVDINGEIRAGTALEDALNWLSERHDLPIILDAHAFTAIGIADPLEQPVQLPAMHGARLATVLRLLLVQVKGDGECGTYIIHDDFVEITTTAHEFLVDSPSDRLPLSFLVDAKFASVPLDEAVRQLSVRSGCNIIIDLQLGERAHQPVSATLRQARVGTAVQLLADMAGAGAVAVDNVIYVTTKEKALAVEAREQRREAATVLASVKIMSPDRSYRRLLKMMEQQLQGVSSKR